MRWQSQPPNLIFSTHRHRTPLSPPPFNLSRRELSHDIKVDTLPTCQFSTLCEPPMFIHTTTPSSPSTMTGTVNTPSHTVRARPRMLELGVKARPRMLELGVKARPRMLKLDVRARPRMLKLGHTC